MSVEEQVKRAKVFRELASLATVWDDYQAKRKVIHHWYISLPR